MANYFVTGGPGDTNLQQQPSQNIHAGRTQPLDLLVIHSTDSNHHTTLNGELNYLTHGAEGKSVHYLIGRNNGEAYQLVDDGDTAYRARYSTFQGVQNANPRSIGIELFLHEPVDAAHTEGFTNWQRTAVLQLSADILENNGIPLSNVVGHVDISDPSQGKEDPHPYFHFADFKANLKTELSNRMIDDVQEEVVDASQGKGAADFSTALQDFLVARKQNLADAEVLQDLSDLGKIGANEGNVNLQQDLETWVFNNKSQILLSKLDSLVQGSAGVSEADFNKAFQNYKTVNGRWLDDTGIGDELDPRLAQNVPGSLHDTVSDWIGGKRDSMAPMAPDAGHLDLPGDGPQLNEPGLRINPQEGGGSLHLLDTGEQLHIDNNINLPYSGQGALLNPEPGSSPTPFGLSLDHETNDPSQGNAFLPNDGQGTQPSLLPDSVTNRITDNWSGDLKLNAGPDNGSFGVPEEGVNPPVANAENDDFGVHLLDRGLDKPIGPAPENSFDPASSGSSFGFALKPPSMPINTATSNGSLLAQDSNPDSTWNAIQAIKDYSPVHSTPFQNNIPALMSSPSPSTESSGPTILDSLNAVHNEGASSMINLEPSESLGGGMMNTMEPSLGAIKEPGEEGEA